MRRWSVESTRVDFPRLRLRFLDFLVRIWLRKAFLRLSLPEAVRWNRFPAPLFVFTLGILAPR